MASRKVEERAWILSIADIGGWILVCKDEDSEGWHIAWIEPFSTKKSAIAFATNNNWPKPWRAIRGRMTVHA